MREQAACTEIVRRYLIVDDNAAFADNLAEILREEGAAVCVAGSGREAMKHVCAIRFDALVTDMHMPQMSGAELIREARSVDPELPAIVVSGTCSKADLLSTRRIGLLAALIKPAPIARLLELLQRARRGGVIALVEDDEAQAESITELLRDQGFSTVNICCVEELIDLAQARPFLALAHLRASPTEEVETVLRLRTDFPLLPIFAVAARRRDLPLDPPFDQDSLLATIGQHYQERRARAG